MKMESFRQFCESTEKKSRLGSIMQQVVGDHLRGLASKVKDFLTRVYSGSEEVSKLPDAAFDEAYDDMLASMQAIKQDLPAQSSSMRDISDTVEEWYIK